MTTIQITAKFPEGAMEGHGIRDLTDWTAKGVTAEVQFTLPDGTPCTLTIPIPDTFAHVHPLQRSGHVDAFDVPMTLEIGDKPVVSEPL